MCTLHLPLRAQAPDGDLAAQRSWGPQLLGAAAFTSRLCPSNSRFLINSTPEYFYTYRKPEQLVRSFHMPCTVPLPVDPLPSWVCVHHQ